MAELGSASGSIVIDFDGRGVDAAARALSGFDAQSGNVGASLTKVGGVMAGLGAAIAAPFALGVKVAADFEQQLSGIAAVGGADAVASMDQIRAAALQMGADTSFSAAEAASGMEELVKAGIPVQDVLDGAAQGALDLAAATGSSVPQAAEIMGVALNVFGDSMEGFNTAGEQAVHVADLFAASAANTNADVGDLSQALGQSALVADQFGFSIDETIGVLSAFADAGLKGSDAGTSLKTALLAIGAPTDVAATAMAAYGIEVRDGNGAMKSAAEIAEELATGLGGLGDAERDAALKTIFGADAIRAANILYEQGAEGINEYTDLVNQQGAAQEQAAIRLDNFNGAMEQLKGSIETALIVVGTTFLPVLRAMAEGLTALVNIFLSLPPSVQTALSIFGALSGVMLLAAGGALLFAGRIMESVQALKALRAAMALRGVSLAGLAAPVLLFAAAAGLAYAAYKTNFLGIQDLVKDTGKAFTQTYKQMHGDLKGSFGDSWGAAASAVAATGAAIQEFTGLPVAETFMRWGQSVDNAANAFDLLTTPVTEGGAGWTKLAAGVSVAGGVIEEVTGLPVADDFNRWGQGIQGFTDNLGQSQQMFDYFQSRGINPVTAALEGLLVGFEGMPAALAEPIQATADLATYLEQVGETGSVSNAMLDKLPESLQPAAIAMGNMTDAAFDLKAAFDEGGLSGALAALPAEAAQFGSALLDLAKIAANVAVDVVVNIGSWLIGKAADFAGFLQDVVTGQGSGAGAELHDVLVNVLSWVVNGAKDLWGKVVAFATGLITGNYAGTPTSAEGYANVPIQGVGVEVRAWLVDGVKDLWAKVVAFATGLITGETGAVPIQSVGVEVRAWIVSSVANLWEAVTRFVTGGAGNAGDGFGTPGSDSPSTANTVSLGSIGVSIAGYIAAGIESVWGWLQGFVMGGGGGAAGGQAGGGYDAGVGQGVNLKDVAVSVGKWLDNGIESVWGWLTDTAIPNMGDAIVNLASVAVKVGAWANGGIESVWAWLQKLVGGGGMAGDGFGTPGSGSASTAGVNLGTVLASVAGWKIGDLSVADLWSKLSAAVMAVLNVDDNLSAGFVDAANALGANIGETVTTAIIAGLKSAFGGGGGGGQGALGNLGGGGGSGLDISDAVRSFLDGIGTGIMAAVKTWASDAGFVDEGGDIDYGAIVKAIGAKFIDGVAREFSNGPGSDLLGKLSASVATWLNGIDDAIGNAFSGGGMAGDGFGTPGSDSASTSQGFAANMAENVLAAFESVKGLIATGVDAIDLFGSVGTWIGGQLTKLQGLIPEAPDVDLPDWITNPIGWLTEQLQAGAAAEETYAAATVNIGKGTGEAYGGYYSSGVEQAFASLDPPDVNIPPPVFDPSILIGEDAIAAATEAGTIGGTNAGTAAGGAIGQGVLSALPPAVATGLAGLDLSQDAQIRQTLGAQGVNISGMANDEIVAALQQHGFQGIPGAMTAAIVPPISQGFDGVVTALPSVGGGAAGIGPAIATTVVDGITTTDFSSVGLALRTKLAQSLALTDDVATSMASMGAASTGGGGGGGMATGIIQTMIADVQAADFSAIGAAITAKISEALSAVTSGGGATGAAPAGGGGILAGLIAGMQADLLIIGEAITLGFATIGTGIGIQVGMWATSITTAMLGITTAVTTGVAEVGIAVTVGFATIGTGIGIQVAMWATSVTTAMTSITTAVTTGVQAVGTAVTVGFATIGTGIATQTSMWVTSITTALTQAAAAVRTQMAAIAQATQAGIQQASQAIQAGMQQIAQAVQTGAQRAVQAMQAGMQQIAQVVQSGIQQASQAMQAGMQQIVSVTTSGMQQVAQAGTQGAQQFAQAIQAGMQQAVAAVQQAGSQIASTLQQVASQAASAGQQAGDGFASGMESGMARAIGAAQSAVASIVATLNGAAAGAFSAGAAVGDGFASGMESALGRVQAAASSMVAAAAAATNAAAQIASPSKLFQGKGRQIGEGLALGIEDEYGHIMAAAAGAIDAASALVGAFSRPARTDLALGPGLGAVLAPAGRGGGSSSTTVNVGGVNVTSGSGRSDADLAREVGDQVAERVYAELRLERTRT